MSMLVHFPLRLGDTVLREIFIQFLKGVHFKGPLKDYHLLLVFVVPLFINTFPKTYLTYYLIYYLTS